MPRTASVWRLWKGLPRASRAWHSIILGICLPVQALTARFGYGVRTVAGSSQAIPEALGNFNLALMTGICWAGNNSLDTARWKWPTARNAACFTSRAMEATLQAPISAATDEFWQLEPTTTWAFGIHSLARKLPPFCWTDAIRTFFTLTGGA